jgi:hypothetical protein
LNTSLLFHTFQKYLNIFYSQQILHQKNPTVDDDNISTSMTYRLADDIEKQLFRSAQSFRHYADASTFKSRLLLASMTLIRRRIKKSQKQSRQEVLQQVLGNERFLVVQQIVQIIKDLKIQALMKGSLNTAIQSAKQKESSIPMMKAQGNIPQPARSLFFNTAIVTSFETASVSLIPSLDWDSMIRDAQENIKAFKEWELESRLGYLNLSETLDEVNAHL